MVDMLIFRKPLLTTIPTNDERKINNISKEEGIPKNERRSTQVKKDSIKRGPNHTFSSPRHPIIYSARESRDKDRPSGWISPVARHQSPSGFHFRTKFETSPLLNFISPSLFRRTGSANSKLDDSSWRIMAPNYRPIDPTN